MQKSKVAYLGPKGTFSQSAAEKYVRDVLNEEALYFPMQDFESIFCSLENKSVDFAIIPIENATEGVVTPCMDLLLSSEVKIMAELYLPIQHVLLATQSIDLSRIEKIYSHPQALSQCARFLRDSCKNAQLISMSSTAASAEFLLSAEASQGAISAVVGPFSLAKIYQLTALAYQIQDLKNNETRFLVLGNFPVLSAEFMKTSIIVALNKDEPGALYRLLSFFEAESLNLTRIESRPYRSQVGEYFFYIDFEGDAVTPSVNACLKKVKAFVNFYKNLGSYPTSNV